MRQKSSRMPAAAPGTAPSHLPGSSHQEVDKQPSRSRWTFYLELLLASHGDGERQCPQAGRATSCRTCAQPSAHTAQEQLVTLKQELRATSEHDEASRRDFSSHSSHSKSRANFEQAPSQELALLRRRPREVPPGSWHRGCQELDASFVRQRHFSSAFSFRQCVLLKADMLLCRSCIRA